MQSVGLAVVDRDPIGIELRRRVRRAGIEWRGFLLRDLLHFAEQLRSRSLIEAGLVFAAENADRLKQAQGAKSIGIGGIFLRLQRDLHMRFRPAIVDLLWLRF